jgi:hypothetical protein
MGKKLLIMMVAVLFITYVSGCQGKGAAKTDNSVNVINSQSSETIKNAGSNEIGSKTSNNNNASTTKVHSVSRDEIVSYFILTKEEILRKLGSDYRVIRTGAEGSYQGYQYKDMGLIFVFESDNKVGFILCDDKLEINNARAGMNFVQIQEKLGEAKIEDTWYETPDNKAYKISYTTDNCVIQFKSFKKDGSDSRLTVYRKRQPN